MTKNRLTALQLYFLSFSYLYGDILLGIRAYRAGNSAWLSALAGSLAGILYLALLRRLLAGYEDFPALLRHIGGAFLEKAVCFLLFLTFLYTLIKSLAGFGDFWNSVSIPTVSPFVFASCMLVTAYFACSKGLCTIGRFAEVLAFIMMPLVLILLLTFVSTQLRFPLFPFPSTTADVNRLTEGAFQTILSPFADAAAFLFLIGRTASKHSLQASASARAVAAGTDESFRLVSLLRPKKDPVKAALLWGGGTAGFLLVCTVIRDEAAIGPSLLSALPYPADFTAQLVGGINIEPFTDLLLSVAYALKAAVLLYASAQALRSCTDLSERTAITVPSLFCLAFLFLFLYTPKILPDLKFAATFPALFEIILPVFLLFAKKRQKTFDKDTKRKYNRGE